MNGKNYYSTKDSEQNKTKKKMRDERYEIQIFVLIKI
jgi:hypothetical protein